MNNSINVPSANAMVASPRQPQGKSVIIVNVTIARLTYTQLLL